MARLIHALGPYAKAVVLVLALAVAVIAEAAGVDVGLNPSDIWQLLGAAALVFVVPNRTSE